MPNLGWVRAIGAFATFWNAIGVLNYLSHVGLIGEGPPLGGSATPAAVTACFAVGVFAGAAGSIGLAVLSRWASPLLWLSWIGSVIDWAWTFGWSGATSVALGITVLSLATFFALVAEWTARALRTSADGQ